MRAFCNKWEREIALLLLGLIVAAIIVGFIYAQNNLDDYIVHGGRGTVVQKTYDGREFSVVVDWAHDQWWGGSMTYTVREKNFDALHLGESVSSDHLN